MVQLFKLTSLKATPKPNWIRCMQKSTFETGVEFCLYFPKYNANCIWHNATFESGLIRIRSRMMVYFITWLFKILYSEPWPYFPYLDWCPDVVYLAGSSMRKLKPKWRTLTSKIEGRQQFSYHFSHLTVSLNKLSVHKTTIFLLNWCQNMKKKQ